MVSGYTCHVGEHEGFDDADARTSTDLFCGELVSHHAPRGEYDVRFGKLGSRVLFSARERTNGEERRVLIQSIEEVPLAAGRLVEALAEKKTVAETQSVDNVVVDIGASNVEELLKLMRRYQDSQQDFDGYVVPTVPARKQQQDTAATLGELARIGVQRERLRVVFNQVDEDDPFDSTFATLLAYCASTGVAIPNAAALISFNEVYSLVRGTGQSLAELAADSTDYKALIAQAGKPSDRLALARRLATQRLARGVVPELDACFAALDLQSLPTGAQTVPSA